MHRQTWAIRDVGEAGRKTLRQEEDGWAGLGYGAGMNPSCSTLRNRKPEIYLLASHWRQPSLAIRPWHEDLLQKKQQQQLGCHLPGPELQKVVTIGRSISRASSSHLYQVLLSPSVVQLLACLPSSPRSRLRLYVHQPLPNTVF